MKGQFVFEFIIAGVFFFAIVLYSINYLNINVSDFKADFHQNVLQAKAVQASEILMNDKASMGLVDGIVFNDTKIQNFNSMYCDSGSYDSLVEDFHLYDIRSYGVFPKDINIFVLIPTSGMILDCGMPIPRGVEKAEITRFGLHKGEAAVLGVVIW
jgi:hypothetical protein